MQQAIVPSCLQPVHSPAIALTPEHFTDPLTPKDPRLHAVLFCCQFLHPADVDNTNNPLPPPNPLPPIPPTRSTFPPPPPPPHQAHHTTPHCTYMPPPLCPLQSRQLLVAVGLEEPGVSTATLKLWDTDKAMAAAAAAASSSSGAATAPAPLRSLKVFSSKYPESEVTALSIHDPSSSSGMAPAPSTVAGTAAAAASSSSTAAAAAAGVPPLLIAVGLAAGSVYLFSLEGGGAKCRLHHTGRLNARPDTGELWKVNTVAFTTQQHTRSGSSSGGGSRQTAAAAPDASSSTARSKAQQQQQQQQQQQGGAVWLYVVTESQTLCYNMSDMSRTILDQQGSSCGSCAVVRDDGVLVVSRDDALYEYTTDTRAGCTAFDGE